MNMNPFSKIINQEKDLKKRAHLEKISQISKKIFRKVLTGKLTNDEVDEYAKATKQYFKEYPDIAYETSVNNRIRKLRAVCKM